MMRNAIVAVAFALVLASPAKASDYLTDIAPYDWTGVYGGVHVGFIQANVSVENRDLDFDRDFNGFAGGVLGGVNFQAGNVVFGLDMDFGGVAPAMARTMSTASASSTAWIGLPMSEAALAMRSTGC